MLADCGANLKVQEINCDEEPLEMAAQMGHLEVIKFLEGKGAKVSDKKLIIKVLNEKMDAESISVLQFLVDRNPDYLARHEGKLFKLCAEGNFGELEALIKVGANARAKNAEGQSLLDVVGTKSAYYRTQDKQWPKQLQKMKSVLEKAMKKK